MGPTEAFERARSLWPDKSAAAVQFRSGLCVLKLFTPDWSKEYSGDNFEACFASAGVQL